MNFRQQPQTKPGNDTAYQNVEKYQRIMKPRFRQSQNPKFIFGRGYQFNKFACFTKVTDTVILDVWLVVEWYFKP